MHGFLWGAVMIYLACVGGCWPLGGWALSCSFCRPSSRSCSSRKARSARLMFLKMLYTLIAVNPTAADYFSLAGVIHAPAALLAGRSRCCSPWPKGVILRQQVLIQRVVQRIHHKRVFYESKEGGKCSLRLEQGFPDSRRGSHPLTSGGNPPSAAPSSAPLALPPKPATRAQTFSCCGTPCCSKVGGR